MADFSWEYTSVSTIASHRSSPFAWRFTSRQPMSSGATSLAGRAKKDGGKVLGERGGYGRFHPQADVGLFK